MALLIMKREIEDGTGPSHEVYGSKTGKIYFSGTFEECQEEVKRRVRNFKARTSRRARNDAMSSLGLVKVRGAIGGTYWE